MLILAQASAALREEKVQLQNQVTTLTLNKQEAEAEVERLTGLLGSGAASGPSGNQPNPQNQVKITDLDIAKEEKLLKMTAEMKALEGHSSNLQV